MNPYIRFVQPQDNYLLLLTFDNGEKRAFDLKPYLDKGVFGRLKNPASFKTARVVSGSVEWQGEIDLSYDTLYVESRPVQRVLTKQKGTSKGRKRKASLASKTRQIKPR